MLKESRGGCRQDDVVDVQQEVGGGVSLAVDEQRGIGACRAEAEAMKKRCDALVPGARGLLQPVQRAREQAHPIRVVGINKPSGLLAEDLLLKMAVEEGFGDVQLVNRPGVRDREVEDVDVKPHIRWETPRGRYDVVQQQFSLSKKPRLSIQEELESAQKVASCKCGATPVLTWNLHTTQSNYFAPTKQEGCQSPRLAEKQRIKRMVWKMNVDAKSGQRANDEECGVNGDCFSVQEWTEVHSSLVVSLHKR